MTLIAISFGLLLVGAAAVQLLIAMMFQKRFDTMEPAPMPEAEQAPTVVVICVRGCDPSLEACLIGALNQNYANYRVKMIVDHQSDQAWDFVHDIKSKHDDRDILSIVEMQSPLETCSLKCSGIRCFSGRRRRTPFTMAGGTNRSVA